MKNIKSFQASKESQFSFPKESFFERMRITLLSFKTLRELENKHLAN